MNRLSDLKPQLKGVLFDFDGTLLDSFAIHYEAYRVMFSRFDIHVSEEQFTHCYSPDWYHTYRAVGLPEETWELANTYWLEEAAKHVATLFPEVPDVLTELSHRYALGIVTSGSRNRVMRDLERTAIKQHFQSVVTGNDVKEPKPAPDGLEIALRQLKLQAHEVVYVGDAFADYEMAQAANVSFVGVASAFTRSGAELPFEQVSSIKSLIALF